MTNQSDQAAAEAIRAHHHELHTGVRARVSAIEEAVRRGEPYTVAREELLVYLEGEILPHAAAEEVTLYAAADTGMSAMLVRAMRNEHKDLVLHVEELRNALDGLAAATIARAILALFESHLSKENDLLVPALVADPTVSLEALLSGMHELVG